MTENWRPVLGYEELYEVSDLGRVRSVTYIREYRSSRRVGKTLKMVMNNRGYITVRLCKNSKETRYHVHRLVLEAFVARRQSDEQACHRDGVKQNNALTNLRWGTAADNMADKMRHGTQAVGGRHGMSRLSDEDARAASARILAGESPTHLAREFGVSRGLMSHIKHGRRRVV